MSEIRKRKGRFANKNKTANSVSTSKEKQKEDGGNSTMYYMNLVFGVCAMLTCGYIHSNYMSTLHENQMFFIGIKEVEREISFRTESGLYYSYYKQMVKAKSISAGIHSLIYDNLTEYPSTINILERMNVYQEVFLAIFYKILSIRRLPVFFYIDTVYNLHGCLVMALFIISWRLSGSWLAGVLSSVFYNINYLNTTRIALAIPLRESFSLPFIWIQQAAITFYLRNNLSGRKEKICTGVIIMSTFLYALFWQFNQFIMLLQSISLFGVWILDMVQPYKVRRLLLILLGSMLGVWVAQFGNSMIPASLGLSFTLMTLLLMKIKGDNYEPSSFVMKVLKAVLYSISVLVLMAISSAFIKFLLKVDSDDHIYKFLQNKFGFGELALKRDFDSRLYLCLDIFNFLPFDTYILLTFGGVFPFYAATHFGLFVALLVAVYQNWSKRENADCKSEHILSSRPDLAFHTVQCVMFGLLAMTTMRMIFLWTPYMCVLASYGITNTQFWAFVSSKLKMTEQVGSRAKHAAAVVVIAVLLAIKLPAIYANLQDLREFWDPDTVELMEWINKDIPRTESFTGSMQLLAGVKLCTERPITNHPHYEDKYLRQKTKQLYQIYGRREPKDVHAILKKHKSNYIILEDSICRAPPSGGCRLPDLIDVDNGVIPDYGEEEPGLENSSVPRFCENIRHGGPEYTKYFKKVFENKTFRVHKVL